MLKRVRIRGYKSLVDVEAKLEPLSVLLGPNAAGKSNFLDALQLLSRLGASKTLKEAFGPPHRGKPLESFSFGPNGVRGSMDQDRLVFSIEADLHLSDSVVEAVDRQIQEMRRPSGAARSDGPGKARHEFASAISAIVWRSKCCPDRASCAWPTSTSPP